MYCGKNITDVVSVTTLSNFDISCCTEGNMVYVQDENAFYLVRYEQLVKRVDLSGLVGVPGAPGKSAYDIAVENGFIGTEAEWLESLKCECDCGGGGTDPEPEPGDYLIPAEYFDETKIAYFISNPINNLTQFNVDNPLSNGTPTKFIRQYCTSQTSNRGHLSIQTLPGTFLNFDNIVIKL